MYYVLYFHFVCGAIVSSYWSKQTPDRTPMVSYLVMLIWPYFLGEMLHDHYHPLTPKTVEPKMPTPVEPEIKIPTTRFKG